MEKHFIFKVFKCDFNREEHVSENLIRNTGEGWDVFHIEGNVIIYRKEVDKKTRDKYYRQVAKKVDDLNHIFID